MCPGTWQAQYNLIEDMVPQSVHKLFEYLKCIEKAFPTEKEQATKKGKMSPGDSNKRKMVSFSEHIPTKDLPWQETLCFVQETWGRT